MLYVIYVVYEGNVIQYVIYIVICHVWRHYEIAFFNQWAIVSDYKHNPMLTGMKFNKNNDTINKHMNKMYVST